MKVDAARLQSFHRQWPADISLVLLHGPDLAASRDYADLLCRQFADPANPMAVETLAGGQLASDPQALVAAANAISMFGDRTLVRIDGLEEDGLPAISALLESRPANPVVAVAGALKKGSKLQALAESSPAIAALLSYEPGIRDAQRLCNDIGNPMGLRVGREAAVMLFEAAAGDRTVMRRELEKLGLYLDSDAEQQKTVEPADIAAIGVGVGDSDQFVLGAAVAGGQMAQTADLLSRLPAGLGIAALRAVERRLTLLLSLRGVVDGGASPQTAVDAARPPIFWKEKEAVAAELRLWTTPALVSGLAETLGAERAIKASGSVGDLLAETAILALARRAAARKSRR